MEKSFENIINYTNACSHERTCDSIICKDNLANYHNLINHSIIIVTEKKNQCTLISENFTFQI